MPEKDEDATPIHKNQPYFSSALDYLHKGWWPLPLPEGKKHSPEKGLTGGISPFPDPDTQLEMVESWRNTSPRGNVALRMGHNVIGLDVDDYPDGKEDPETGEIKIKEGYNQLKELEAKLGPLPPTWVSSARFGIEGQENSGTRFYRIDPEWQGQLEFVGKAPLDVRYVNRSIDIIQFKHRYSAVYPSINPDADGARYEWKREDGATIPGEHPDGDEYGHVYAERLDDGVVRFVEADKSIPYVSWLPELPEAWLNYLTNDKTLAVGTRIDMDSSLDDLSEWLSVKQRSKPRDDVPADAVRDDGLVDRSTLPMCRQMRKTVNLWKKHIDEDASSHDKIRDAYWAMVGDALKGGHRGLGEASAEIRNYWIDDVASRDKRSAEEVQREVFRSETNAIRKYKAESDAAEARGINMVSGLCSCFDPTIRQTKTWLDADGNIEVVQMHEAEFEGSIDISPPGLLEGAEGDIDPGSYENSDTGIAQLIEDMYQGNLKYIEDKGKWALWNAGRWSIGGGFIAHGCLNQAKDLLKRYALSLKGAVDAAEEALANAQEGYVESDKLPKAEVYGKESVVYGELQKAKKAWQSANDFALRYGNYQSGTNALRKYRDLQSRKYDGHDVISVQYFDTNPLVLGVSETVVIELADPDAYKAAKLRGEDPSAYSFRPAQREDRVTKSLNVPWNSAGLEGLIKEDEGGSIQAGANEWQRFLDSSVPGELQDDLQILAGVSLHGDNIQQIMVWLQGRSGSGKSTFNQALQSAVSDYGAPVDSSLYHKSKFNEQQQKALGMRFMFGSEFSDDTEISADMIKQITGNEEVSVKMKNQNGTVDAKLGGIHFVATNLPPKIKGSDAACKRRFVVVPFEEHHGKIDELLSQRLKDTAGPAIVYWIIDGWGKFLDLRCSEEYDGRLRNMLSEKVKDRSHEFGDNTTDVGEYINEALVKVGWEVDQLGTNKNPNHEYKVEHCIPKRLAYEVWCRYCRANDVPEAEYKGTKTFYSEMSRQGIESASVKLPRDDGDTTVQVACFLGVQISEEWAVARVREIRSA